jgi:hypothetical protein
LKKPTTMDARELRIGNWIIWEGKPYQVEPEDFYAFLQYDNDAEPTPLTPEILEACGFEWDIFYQGFTNGRYVINILHDGRISFAYGKRRHDDMQFMPYIKYLHQLQNLYYSLTGTELEVKSLDKIKQP